MRWLTIGTGLALLGGGVWGFVRGLDYLPTLPVAVTEGAIIVGVPGCIAAAILAGLISAVHRVYRLKGPRTPDPHRQRV